MRILILQDDFPPESHGGAGIAVFTVAHALQKRGHKILVVTTVRRRESAGEVLYQGLRVCRIATSYPLRFQAYVSLWNIPAVRRLKTVIKEFKPDVVHAHNVHSYLSYRSLAAAKRSGARVVLSCHDAMSVSYGKMTDSRIPTRRPWWRYGLRDNPFRNAFIRSAIRSHVDRVVAVSRALRDALEENGIRGIAVVHNGVDAEAWREPEEAVESFRKSHGLGNSVVLFAGRLTRIKGATKIIEAIALLKEKVPGVQLLVVGRKDEYAEGMLKKAHEAGIAERLIFTGWLSGHALHQAYHAASVVTVPSLYLEPFGLVALEGMAARKPVVATCFGGPPEIVEDGVTGFIVDPNDVPAMSGKLGELLQDTEKAAVFGEKGYERVLKEFSLEHQAEEYEKIYGEK